MEIVLKNVMFINIIEKLVINFVWMKKGVFHIRGEVPNRINGFS